MVVPNDWSLHFRVVGRSQVTPLNALAVLNNKTICGIITPKNNSIYMPILREADWENIEDPLLSTGEIVVIALVAALYAILLLLAAIMVGRLLFHRKMWPAFHNWLSLILLGFSTGTNLTFLLLNLCSSVRLLSFAGWGYNSVWCCWLCANGAANVHFPHHFWLSTLTLGVTVLSFVRC